VCLTPAEFELTDALRRRAAETVKFLGCPDGAIAQPRWAVYGKNVV
jgi:hypothetical protein